MRRLTLTHSIPEKILEKLKSVIQSLDRHGETPVNSKNPKAAEFRYVSIPSGEAEALKNWVIREKASNSIEIGLAYGYSALHICEGLLLNDGLNSRHTIIDPSQIQDDGYAKAGLDILSCAGLDSIIEFHPDLSQIALPKLWSENRKFDFAFVDGNHKSDYVFVDLFYLEKLLVDGSVIFLDDYNYPGIKKAASFYINNLNWKIEETGNDKDHEWAVIRTSDKPDSRHFKYFADY